MPNRSMPPGDLIPELAYPDVRAAAAWLCQAFGFHERLRIGGHRVQLTYGHSALVVTQLHEAAGVGGHALMLRVADANAHCAQAQAAGATITHPPTDYPFGERQYTATDLGGHHWTFSQSLADIDPASWGGELVG